MHACTNLLRTTLLRAAVLSAVCLVAAAAPARAQLGALASPGPLSKAHSQLEGLAKCQSCHEPGRQVTVEKCLSCHQPIKERIAKKKGVHRDVTDTCVLCHVEHNGADADMRPIDPKSFDHAAETGFALDGRHAPLAKDCARCHKTRSFIQNTPACVSCHKDQHNGTLGTKCDTCHTTAAPFKDASKRFDHTKAQFQLTGKHEQVACSKCHVNGQFKGLKFANCDSCHTDPHKTKFGTTCTACHATSGWPTQKVDHAKTAFPLAGKHQQVACSKCHVQAPMKAKPKGTKCADCHSDVHRGQFKEGCETCHKEVGFGTSAAFDHGKRTTFALTGKHAALECAKCHKGISAKDTPAAKRVVDFRGNSPACASCHQDPHRGELGTTCEKCHSPESFKVTTFTHPSSPEFFVGNHANLPCAKCHVPAAPTAPTRTGMPPVQVTFKNVSMACASCHKDAHLGQLGTDCASCHAVDGNKFAAVKFSHARSAFALTGLHQQVPCAKCHKSETAAFPAGNGTAVRFKGLQTTCATCHKDPHLGQLGAECATCHTTSGFPVKAFTHKGLDHFFVGRHATAECAQCHKKADAVFPAGRGTAVKFKVGTQCSSCHTDAHRGSLGTECASCHSPEDWRNPSKAFHKSTVFPLEGRHLAVPCTSCHVKGQLKGTPMRCYDCHWIRRQDDRYKTRLGNECQECHRPTSWTAVNWDHGSRTGTPLNIAHRLMACDSCHKNQDFKGARPECFSCHERDYSATQTPNHKAAGFPLDCTTCHSPSSSTFAGARFDHSTFQRVGAHATATCDSCHRNGTYKGTPRDCVGCHQADYQRTTNPNHAAASFPTTCDSCHRNTDPSWRGATFNHSAAFPLVGTHATVACQSCHKNAVYKGTSRECAGCHMAKYQAATSPNHAASGFPTTCESCHKSTATSWQGATFNHTSAYPLRGSHSTAQCASCHKNNVYKGTSQDCVTCHQPDYQRAANPNHVAAGFPTTCVTCHREGGPGWQTQAFSHTSAFPLSGMHASASCTSCHKNGTYKGNSSDCFSCHQADYQRAATPNHVTAGFPTACATCHKSGGPGWTSGSFTHTSAFPLSGMHATAACASCHKNNVYKGTARDCVGCHQPDYQRAANPNHASAGFPTACESCHKNGGPGWKGATFNHNQTWNLQGSHASTACASCHKNNVYKGTARDCVGCHQPDYQRAANPNHVAANFSTACESCHRNGGPGWTNAAFTHNQYWTLSGTHGSTACASCHKNNVYKGTPRDCVGCHQSNYNATTNPNHAAAVFPTACESCHRNGGPGWSSTFNHSTTFTLLGLHATTQCASCHKNNVYKGTARDCLPCHQTKYQATTNPNHVAAAFPTTCESCHKNGGPGWTGATFNHGTTWALQGSHATAACTSCHKNNVYKGTPRDCVGCHQSNYNATTNPSHATAGFPTACESCHRNGGPGWSSTFNHGSTYALAGMHATIACSSCHKNNVYKGTPRDCAGCHLTKYNATTNPPHGAAGFATTCDSCHKNGGPGWTPATFNHTTYWALQGSHATQPCASCHKNNVYKGTPRDCASCHLAKYNATTNPNHAAAVFPTTCETCHRNGGPGWSSTFNHSTTFTLLGLHATTQCSNCHKNNVYKGTARECYPCHQAKYTATTSPNHVAAAFPTTCESCHKNGGPGWTPATFNHATYFALQGVHATQTCTACHKNNIYKGTPRDCAGCHIAKYNATTNPRHLAAGFPTTCETCHRATDTAWTQGTFNHTWFPITSGKHANNPCSACHTDPNNYKVFSCLTCHSKAEADKDHQGRAGYRYDSAACYSCHPQGRS